MTHWSHLDVLGFPGGQLVGWHDRSLTMLVNLQGNSYYRSNSPTAPQESPLPSSVFMVRVRIRDDLLFGLRFKALKVGQETNGFLPGTLISPFSMVREVSPKSTFIA